MQAETKLQIAVTMYLRYRGVLFSASLNGMYTTGRQAGIHGAMGMSAGEPDIRIFDGHGGYIGMALELKSQSGRLRDNQKQWLEDLRQRGWYCAIGRPEDWLEIMEEYLDQPRTRPAKIQPPWMK